MNPIENMFQIFKLIFITSIKKSIGAGFKNQLEWVLTHLLWFYF
jgi:hypothetical protein